jgi:hypothetical protein
MANSIQNLAHATQSCTTQWQNTRASARVNRTVGRPVPTVLKKPAGIPVKPAGSLRVKNIRHGLGVGTGPVRVPSRTGSTRNRTGSHRFCEPWQVQVATKTHFPVSAIEALQKQRPKNNPSTDRPKLKHYTGKAREHQW